MATERTFSIIKPDAVERNKIGEITAMLESAGLRIVASKRIKLNGEKAAQFGNYTTKLSMNFHLTRNNV